jgi:hypothetical protein
MCSFLRKLNNSIDAAREFLSPVAINNVGLLKLVIIDLVIASEPPEEIKTTRPSNCDSVSKGVLEFKKIGSFKDGIFFMISEYLPNRSLTLATSSILE